MSDQKATALLSYEKNEIQAEIENDKKHSSDSSENRSLIIQDEDYSLPLVDPIETSSLEMPEDQQPAIQQTLSLSEDHAWMDTDHATFISQRLQDLVHAFQARTEKVKEKIVQPPTPSPSPPLESDPSHSDSEMTSRPRLQSLILQEDDKPLVEMKRTVKLCCCKVKKKYLPTFPEVIDPQSKIYICWLFFVMSSYVYNAWSIVLRAVFPYQTPQNTPVFLMFDYACDIIYIIDIALFKCRLQFLHDGFWVDTYEKTKDNYVGKTTFKIDVLSLFPLDFLYFVYGINPLFRLPRFLKVQTFWEFFHRVDAVAKTPYVIRIIRTLIYMMYLIHLNACAYYAMSTWEGIGSNGWVFQGEGNAYIRCFYFATKTATSIGKNPKPENEYEYVFMTISWLMGVFIFAFLIGQIRDIVATATQTRTQYRQLMDQTVMYMRNLNLPDDLQRRVRLWLNHTWEQQKTLNERGILDTLPRKMKTDVAINVHYNTLVKVQLFKDCDKALLRDLVLQLKPVLFLPGDYVCRKGEVGKEMYIVNKGIVQVFGGENQILASLSEGSVFGEISLLGIPGCNRRTADVRSKGFSNLFVLSKDDLWEALKNYPEAQKVLKKKAKFLIKENEARDQANRGYQTNVQPETVINQTENERPETPKFIRAVLQLIPKESKCHRRTSFDESKSPMNIPTEMDSSNDDIKEHKINNTESDEKFYENISTYSTKEGITSPKLCASPPVEKKDANEMGKPRSMSDGIIKSKQDIHLAQIDTKVVKGDCCQSKDDSRSEFLKSILNMLPTELTTKKPNAVHPVAPNTNSEDSGISIDNSIAPPSQKTETECPSEDQSGDLSEITRNMASSVLSLKLLFGGSSTQSSPSSNKDCLPSPKPGTQTRPQSLTSSSSSVGFDNLGYVPVDILSRRSSIFSDASC